MTNIPSNPDLNDSERLLRTSLQRALLQPAPRSIAAGVQQRLAALPAPSRFLRGLMRYGTVLGLAILVMAVIVVVVIGQPHGVVPIKADPGLVFTRLVNAVTTTPPTLSITSIAIGAFLLYGFVTTELSRR